MHIHFSHSELAALRLAAGLSNYPDVETFVREVVMQPVRGRDILSIQADER